MAKTKEEAPLLDQRADVTTVKIPNLAGLPATDSAAMAAAGMAGIIERVMQNPEMDVSKVQALLDMQLQIWDRMAKMAFVRDFSAMSLVLPKIKKTKEVSYKNKETGRMEVAFKHEILEDLDDVVRPLMAQHNFTFSYTTKNRDGGGLIAVGTLTHKDGHEKVAEIPLAIDTSGGKTNLQGMGSTASYGVRYLQKILLNIITVDEDTDGQGDHIDVNEAVRIDQQIASFPDAETYKPKFLQFMKVERVDLILQKDHQKALVALAEKEKKLRTEKKAEA